MGGIGEAGSLPNRPQQSLAEILKLLRSVGQFAYSLSDFAAPIRNFPLGSLTDLLMRGESGEQYVLEPDLLIRHASGRLFQEAHIQLERNRNVQISLFVGMAQYSTQGRAAQKRNAHYTPPSLARLLLERALAALADSGISRSQLEVLDPACGSGVFLIEAIRELAGEAVPLKLSGIDTSAVSIIMAKSSLGRVVADSAAQPVTLRLANADSLTMNWGDADIIAMNPPFRAWSAMDATERHTVKAIMGDWYYHRPDLAVAFVAKAIKSLRPGAVLATVIPAVLLQSDSSRLMRQAIESDPELSVRLIGRFRGFGYFTDATVEPAFMVIARLQGRITRPMLNVLADPGHAEEAIRGLRRGVVPSFGDGYEVFAPPQRPNEPFNWFPRQQKSETMIRPLRESTGFTISTLFEPRLGIRPGDKTTFIIDSDELRGMCSQDEIRAYFRPIADRIVNGSIRDAGYIFYPYDESGQLSLQTEADVARSVAGFYNAQTEACKR